MTALAILAVFLVLLIFTEALATWFRTRRRIENFREIERRRLP